MVEDLLVEVLVEQVLFPLQQVVQVTFQELLVQLTLVAVVVEAGGGNQGGQSGGSGLVIIRYKYQN